jgi:hypothetical protein
MRPAVKLTGRSPQSQGYLVPTTPVYFGIDVACARGKRLPICVVSGGSPLTPMMIQKHLAQVIPRGVGNREMAMFHFTYPDLNLGPLIPFDRPPRLGIGRRLGFRNGQVFA